MTRVALATVTVRPLATPPSSSSTRRRATARPASAGPSSRIALRSSGSRATTLFSERPGHLIELAEQAARDGAELVVAVGGDGTLNEVVNGLMRAGTTTELATIPLGTGMDFVRTYGIPTRFDDAVRTALDGTTRTIDVGRVSYREWSGADARALRRERRQRRHERRRRPARERHVEGARRQGDVLLRARRASSSSGRTPT